MKMKANITGRTAVANAISNALSTVGTTGSLMLDIASTANKHFKDGVSKEDQDAITQSVSAAQGWKGKTAVSRTSEVRVILRACAKLPQYLKALREKMDSVTWHDAMKLARRINAGDKVSAAVAFVKDNKNAGSDSKPNPKGRALSAILTLYKAVHGENRDVVRKALRMLKDAGVIKVSPEQAERVGL